jgi:hypothetical protein
MLLADRRRGLLFFCLAGMEIGWLTPFFLLFYRPSEGQSPWLAFLGLFGVLISFILMLELLNFLQLDWPYYELAVIALIPVTSVLFVRLWLYGGAPLGDFRWLINTLSAPFGVLNGIRPELVLILTSLFLWQRAANATSRDVGFFGVGLSFRLGILLLILGGSLFSFMRGEDARPILWLYLGLGLSAVALARTLEKATDARSAGSVPSLRRLGQLLLAAGATVVGAAWLSRFYTPGRIKAVLLVVLKPVWTLLSPVLQFVLQALFWVLAPVLSWLELLLLRLAENLDFTFLQEIFGEIGDRSDQELLMGPEESIVSGLPPWFWTGLRYLLVFLVLAGLVGLVLLFLDRVRRTSDQGDTEEKSSETITLGGRSLERGLRWLRDVAGLVRRFGLSRQLLAAISVQNLYANLCRLARRRGYPRHPAQPPDDYLPILIQAFGGREEALERITAAYMRVHYGDQPITLTELAKLRQDYDQVRKSK